MSISRHITSGGNATIRGHATVGKDLKVDGWFEARNIKHVCKGLFRSEVMLNRSYPFPGKGWWALVGDTVPSEVYVSEDGRWVATGKQGGSTTVDLTIIRALEQQLEELSTRMAEDIELHREREYAPLKEGFDRLLQRFELLLGDNASEAIDSFNEILMFLSEVTDSDTLVGMLARVRAVSPTGMVFEAGEDSARLRYRITDLNGAGYSPDPSILPELPVACGPVAGDGVARPQPGQAGIITGDDYGRFDGAAEFASGLADKTALGDIGFTASEGQVSFTRPKYRLDGGNPWVDGDGNPEAVPANGLWPFPMASVNQAGAITAAQARAIADAPELAFRELWRSAGCSVDEAAEPSEMYLCNGLGMSCAEARAVYAAGVMTNADGVPFYHYKNIRTHLPGNINFGVITGVRTFQNSQVEVVRLPLLNPGSCCFNTCLKLRSITVYSQGSSGGDAFMGCPALETLTFYGEVTPGKSFDVSQSPRISLASWQGIIGKARAGSAAMTITVHPDVYAKMTDAIRDSDWTKLPELAAAKNITFTTKD